jgi:N-acetylneuraminate synthase/sialic acid synthase
MREFRFSGHVINEESQPFLIAEIGHNHQGSLENCLNLIRAAAESGCDAVKLQKRDNTSLFTEQMFNEPYKSENSFGDTYGEHRQFLELSKDEYLKCKIEAERLGLVFFATAFDIPSVDFLYEIGVDLIKIASGDLKSYYLHQYITDKKIPMIISTGGASFSEVEDAYKRLVSIGAEFALLQCTAAYPAPPELLNLRVIQKYISAFPKTIIGYSGHDSGIAMPLLSFGLGARIIEKHFTLNRTLKGTDHAFSLEPVGMRKLSRDLKRAHVALGDGIKVKYPEESKPLRKMSKMIVAKFDLPVQHVIVVEDIEFRSPAEGLPPSQVNLILGKSLKNFVQKGNPITFEDVN